MENSEAVVRREGELEAEDAQDLNPRYGNRQLKKFQFSAEVKRKIRLLYRMDNYHGVLACLTDWLVIIVAITLSEWLPTDQRPVISWAAYFVALFVIGTRIRALAELLHQSTHSAICENKILNLVVGSVFSGWPVLLSWTSYHDKHVVKHHYYLGDKLKDPEIDSLTRSGLYRPVVKRQDVINYMWRIPSPKNIAAHVRYLLRVGIIAPNEAPLETFLRLTAYAATFFAFWYLGKMYILIQYWIVPLVTTGDWVGKFIGIFEHYPLLIPSTPQIDLYVSRNRICSAFEEFFLGIHGEGYHLVHHLWPRIPSWYYKEAHKIMMEEPEYREFHAKQRHGWPAIIKEVLAYFE